MKDEVIKDEKYYHDLQKELMSAGIVWCAEIADIIADGFIRNAKSKYEDSKEVRL